jgi:MFS family permease
MGKTESRPAGWGDLVRAGHSARLALLCFGVWLHAADGLLVATMIPGILNDIGGAALVAWVFALYELGSITAGAASALLGLRFGLRRVMTGAACVYLAGCVQSALAPDMAMMLGGRLAQGLGGGGLMALSLVAVSDLLPRPLIARSMASISLVWGASAFTGPLIGGIFADLGYWRGGFWFFAAQAGLLAVWLWFGLRDREAAAGALSPPNLAPRNLAPRRLPLLRLALLALGVLAIAAAGIEVQPLRSPLLVLLGLALIGGFLRLDARRSADRLLPRRPFDPRRGSGAALLMIFCFSAATIGLGAYGPVLMTVLHGTSALTAGYIVALSSIGWSVMAVLTSSAGERHDARLVLAGMGLVTLSIAGFAVAVPSGPLWLIALLATLEGAGFGTAWTFILRRATLLVEADDKQRLAAAMTTVQRLGYAVGAGLVGIIANAAGFGDGLGPETAKGVGFWVFAGFLPLTALGLGAAIAFGRARAAAA